jgi:LuxR family maltose regulon positive regulatory protein
LIRLRREIVQGRSPDAAFKLAGKLATRTVLEVRHRIALSILQAFLHHRVGEAGIARRHLARALRSAEAEGLLAALIEDGESLEKVLPLFLAKPGPGNESLASFAQRVARLLRTLPATPLYSKTLAGVTRQEHRVLSYAADGYTNKQIARAVGASESVVKFHLRNLFKKMGVASRGALRQAAEGRGIRT